MLAVKFKQSKKSESSFFQCPYVSLQQKVWPRLKVCTTMPGSWICFVPGWPWTQRSYLSLLGLKACTTLSEPKLFITTMPQDLHAKIQLRNLYPPASRSELQMNPPILDCSSFQIESSWQPGIAITVPTWRNCFGRVRRCGFLGGVCHWGWVWDFKCPCQTQCPSSVSCLWISCSSRHQMPSSTIIDFNPLELYAQLNTFSL